MTVEEESKKIIEQELQRAWDNLKQQGVERTNRNILNEFTECIQNTLTKLLKNIREICDVVEIRQNELLFWLTETKKNDRLP